MIRNVYLLVDVVLKKTLVIYDDGYFFIVCSSVCSSWQCLKWVSICFIVPFATNAFGKGEATLYNSINIVSMAEKVKITQICEMWYVDITHINLMCTVYFLWTLSNGAKLITNPHLFTFQIPSTDILPTSRITEQTLC